MDKSRYDRMFEEVMHYHFYGRHKKRQGAGRLRNMAFIFFLVVFILFPQSISFSEDQNIDRQMAFQWTRLRTVQIEVYKLRHFMEALLERELVKTGKLGKKQRWEKFTRVQNKRQDD